MQDNFQILFTSQDIQHRVRHLAKLINNDYQGKDLVIIGVLNGGVYFTTDLSRELEIDHELTFVELKSYGNEQQSSGEVKFTKHWDINIDNRDVLVVEDIIDTGKSMERLFVELEKHSPRSVKVATLIQKPRATVQAQYSCYSFGIKQDMFLVGYGLDFKGKRRNLLDIYALIK